MNVTLRIRRERPGMKAHWQSYSVDTAPDAYVLDALEAAYAQDASLVFRHACHHASCGSCAVRINGREALPCIVRVSAAARRGGPITLEPLRNLPLLADLAVDREPMLRTLRQIGMTCIRATEGGAPAEGCGPVTRFEDCIECGICVSACPVAGVEGAYLGPAAMAAADRVLTSSLAADPASFGTLATTRNGESEPLGVLSVSLDTDPTALGTLATNRDVESEPVGTLAATGDVESEPVGTLATTRAGDSEPFATLATTGGADPAAVFALANSRHGVWRCHSAFECTEVCPMSVDPGGAIMRLRRLTFARGGKP